MSTALARRTRADDYKAAQRIAALWHGGRDHNITGLSHGTEWSSRGALEELDGLVERFDANHHEEPAEVLDELTALREFVEGNQTITSVWSAYGHRFHTEDGDEACLSCGARYELVHDDGENVSHGRYRTSNGDDPESCTELSLIHGDAHEAGHSLDCEDGCERCKHECNCLLCRG